MTKAMTISVSVLVPRATYSSILNMLTWDVHVGTVDVFSRRQIPSLLPISTDCLLTRPGLVPPGKQDEEDLVDDVGVRHVEVVLQRRNVDVSRELS